MSGSNGRLIHQNLLQPSSRDTIELGREVERGFLTICDLWARLYGELLPISHDLDSSMLLWRQMRTRHKANDYRNNADELRATRTIAQWTVDINMKARNQKPVKIVWGL